MKNNAKRLLAFLLAALLCVTMVVPAFATEADAAHDHEYKHEVNCDDDCDHKCPTGHAKSCVIEVVKSVCTAAGYTLKYCDDCDHYFVTDVVPAEEGAAHNPGEKVEEGKAATCVSEGVDTSYKCTVCGELCNKDGGEVKTYETIDHEYKDGLCVICGKHEDDSCVGEHKWNFKEVSKEAGETTTGIAVYECDECGAKKEVVIKATGDAAERIYPDSIYVDVDFANGVATDRLGNATLTNKGEVVIGKTDVTFNGTTMNVDALTVNKSGTWVMGTFNKLDTMDKMNAFLANGFSIEALYLDNSSVAAGIVCMTESPNGWGLAQYASTNAPYFITGNNKTGPVVNKAQTTWNAAYAPKSEDNENLIHVVAVYDPATKAHYLYVNGVECGNREFLASQPGTNVPGVYATTTTSRYGDKMFNTFCLGADLSPSTSKAGDFLADNLVLVDAKIYASALTAEEVKMLHSYVVEDFTEKEEVNEYEWAEKILEEKGYNVEDYEILEVTPTLHAYYNCTAGEVQNNVQVIGFSTVISAANGSKATNLNQFWATQIFDKEDLPVGSLILVKEGYQYRPEGWQELDKKSSGRGTNTTEALTTVDADWWGTYNYRAFNVAFVGAKTDVSEADFNAFVIYVPKTHTCGKDTLVKVDAVEGTCTTKATLEHYKCSCGNLYADAEAKTLIAESDTIGDFKHAEGNDWVIVKDSDCLNYGYKTLTCSACGKTEIENIAPKGHATLTDTDRHLAGTKVETILPSCKNDGINKWTCECGEPQDSKIPATGCAIETVTVPATCYTFEFKYTYCKNVACATHAGCDETKVTVPAPYFATVDGKYADTNVANVLSFEIIGTTYDADNHYNAKYGEVRVPADCQNAGVKVDYCSGCHAIDKAYSYGPEGHAFDKENNGVKVSDADCENAAKYTVKCTHCDATENYTVGEALGHKWGAEQTEPATCAGAGYKYKVCERCSKNEKTGDLPFETTAVNGIYKDYAAAKKEHEHINAEEDGVDVREGTCTLVGLAEYECADCKQKVYVQTGVGGEGHDWEDTEDKAVTPDCVTEGYANAQKCTKCGETKPGVKLPALGHDMTEVVAKEETCDENGVVAHFHCEDCGKNFKDKDGKEEIANVVIDEILGHNFVAGVCTNCNEKCEHKYAPINSNVASCDKDALYDGYGFTHFECSECGDEYWTNFVVTPAHDYEEGVITVTPNCTTKGEKADVCKECGEKTKVVVLPETHYNVDGDPIIDSCLDAEEDRLCDKCGETIGKAHNEITTVVDNDCKTLGYTIVACGDCGEVISTVANTTLGNHVYGTPVIVDSTYTAEGTKTEVCTVCGYNKVTTIEKKSGLNIKLVATNKYSFKEYVDGSYVTVKVVADANNVNAWSFKFTVSYNDAVLNFVEGDVATTICGTTTSGIVDAKNGVATIIGFASNNADAKMQNVVLNGEDVVLATLTFRVDTAAEAEATFAVETVEIVDKAGADIDANTTITTKEAKIATQLYLDINNDAVIDLEDLNAMAKIMANEVPADAEIITAAGDVNHDGTIGEADLALLLQYLAGAKTYAQVIGK